MNLLEYLNDAKRSLFRWESLQYYEGDEKRLKLFKTQGAIDPKSMRDWWNFISRMNENGVMMQRVRLVIEPQNEYTTMELEVHRESKKYGDDIRIISLKEYKRIGIELPDFWLIDDKTVIAMKYGLKGKYERFEVQNDADKYVKFKERLIQSSEPL